MPMNMREDQALPTGVSAQMLVSTTLAEMASESTLLWG
jgi:hypothetical protein